MKIRYGFFIAAGFVILFPLARLFLVVSEEPQKADVIIALSGDAGRLEKAAELYHDGYADKVMLSLAGEAGTTVEEAVAFGVPEQDLLLEEKATSTYMNCRIHKRDNEREHF